MCQTFKCDQENCTHATNFPIPARWFQVNVEGVEYWFCSLGCLVRHMTNFHGIVNIHQIRA